MAVRQMPQSLDAEKAVLGAAFLSKTALQKICDELSAESFYSDANAKIFGVLQELNDSDSPIDRFPPNTEKYLVLFSIYKHSPLDMYNFYLR